MGWPGGSSAVSVGLPHAAAVTWWLGCGLCSAGTAGKAVFHENKHKNVSILCLHHDYQHPIVHSKSHGEVQHQCGRGPHKGMAWIPEGEIPSGLLL